MNGWMHPSVHLTSIHPTSIHPTSVNQHACMMIDYNMQSNNPSSHDSNGLSVNRFFKNQSIMQEHI